MKQLFMILSLCICITACNYGVKKKSITNEIHGDTLALKAAELITLIEYPTHTIAEITNPWNPTLLLQRYILVDRNIELPSALPEGIIVRTPLKQSVVYSGVHCSLFRELGAVSMIHGVCDLAYHKDTTILRLHTEGKIEDLGSSMSPSIEKLIELSPDAILLSPFENSGGYGRLEKLGIPIIECADYMESSALGRAEWMRFYGRLANLGKEADQHFDKIEKQYSTLKAMASEVTYRPSVICELKEGSIWYVPSGNSTTNKLIRDAGADYIFRHYDQFGSVPLSFEAVLEKGQNADFWLIKYHKHNDMSYIDLEKEFAGYSAFDAFQNKHIFSCNTGTIPYYEETPFHPEWLLLDMINIFHPELTKGHTLRYFKPLSA